MCDRNAAWKRSALFYLAVWAACVLWFWLGRDGGGWIMAYTILTYGVILPVTTLVTAFRLERRQDLGLWRWAVIVLSGGMYLAAMYATFVLSTAVGAANLAAPRLSCGLIGLFPGALGVGLGRLVRRGTLSPVLPAAGLALLLCFCYVELKTMNGSLWRFLPELDLPALALVLLGAWLLFRGNKVR